MVDVDTLKNVAEILNRANIMLVQLDKMGLSFKGVVLDLPVILGMLGMKHP